MIEDLFTIDQVAERFGVTRRTVNRWIARRKLAVVRISRQTVRVRENAIEKMLERLTERSV